MAKKKDETAPLPSLSAVIAAKGIKTSQNLADMLATLVGDIMEGRVTPQVANAAVRVGNTLLRVVELQIKYGSPVPAGDGARNLRITSGEKPAESLQS